MIFGPNITGSVKSLRPSNLPIGSGNGALYINQLTVEGISGENYNRGCTLNVDASKSNSVYKDSVSTVQAPANQNLIIIKF